jgi:alkylhydroperoxidase family enzyme
MEFNAVARDEMSERLQALYDVCAEIGDTQFIQAGANAPEVLDWYFDQFYKQLFYGGRVDVRIKELVRLRLGRTHGCGLCDRWNTNDALEAGFPSEAVDSVTSWPEPIDPTNFTEAELAAIRYADQMALQNMDGALDPELYAELRRHFDDGELFELGVTMAVLTGMFKFLFIADLTPKMAHCSVPGAAGVSSEWRIRPAERLRSVEKLAATGGR